MPRSPSFRFDCRLAGLFYLGLAITGGLGFMLVRPMLFVPEDPSQTLANLIERPSVARIGIALELGLATFQALAALWFARLFRDVDAFAAGTVAAFGLVNTVAVLASAAFLATALDVAHAPDTPDAKAVHLLYLISGHFWRAGNIFFGLWLIPMGWLCWRAPLGPRLLGWVLVCGGVGYVLNTFVTVLIPAAGLWVVVFPIVATIGEFWMIGLLLWTGMRPITRTLTSGASQSR
jgi:hypothetical protein